MFHSIRQWIIVYIRTILFKYHTMSLQQHPLCLQGVQRHNMSCNIIILKMHVKLRQHRLF